MGSAKRYVRAIFIVLVLDIVLDFFAIARTRTTTTARTIAR
jgi:hypothetical protein